MLTKRLNINVADKAYKMSDIDIKKLARMYNGKSPMDDYKGWDIYKIDGKVLAKKGSYIINVLSGRMEDLVKKIDFESYYSPGNKDAEDPGFDVRNIEEETIANDNFRKVIVTGNNLQLVLMSLPPGGEIGMEMHKDVDQFFRIEEGAGTLDTKASGTYPLKAGSSILIKAGTAHNIIAGDKGIKLYTLYAPPNHAIDIVQKTKEEADAAEQAGTDVPPQKTGDGGPGSGPQPGGGSTEHEEFTKKHPNVSGNIKVASSGHTKSDATKLATELRKKGVFASIFHQAGPHSGENSKYFLVIPKTKDAYTNWNPSEEFKGEQKAEYKGYKIEINKWGNGAIHLQIIDPKGYPILSASDSSYSKGTGIKFVKETAQKAIDDHIEKIARMKNERY